MEALPLLVLELVCEYLGQCEPHRASLLAFASASRVCRAAARRERFSRVSINIDDAGFDESLERLEYVLDQASIHACVRVLELKGCYVFEVEINPAQRALNTRYYPSR